MKPNLNTGDIVCLEINIPIDSCAYFTYKYTKPFNVFFQVMEHKNDIPLGEYHTTLCPIEEQNIRYFNKNNFQKYMAVFRYNAKTGIFRCYPQNNLITYVSLKCGL